MNPGIVVSSLMLACGLTSGAFAQAPRLEFPSPSPACTLKQRVGLTDIEIVYSRPGVKGRAIFGGLVPYGEVWRTGANASTKVSFSTPVKLEGNEVPAGTYALYTIPGESEWTVILSKDTKLNGAFGYKPENDLVRFKVTPVTVSAHVETLTIDLTNIRDESATLYVIWDETFVPMKLEVNVVGKLLPQIESVMAGTNRFKPYFQAAMFYYDHGQDLQQARKWVEAAAAANETYYILHLKARILAKLGDKEGAIAAAKRSSELAVKAEGPSSGYVKMNQDLISSLQ
jgi:hypothetical protein